ncbi:MAG: DUF1232 domain-containing protein [Acidobacteria bacterium]|nr:MAG: DUF1232 domain-containing protein [Acidobacteriota bacterium]
MSASNSQSSEPAAADAGLDLLARDAARAARGELDHLPSTGLLSFYDRLRERVVARIERGGRLSPAMTDALLLVPDVFMLLVRLALDRGVPRAERALVASALAYFVLPFDLMPELALGTVGYADDLVLAVIILSRTFSGDLAPYAEKHWSGSARLRAVLRDVLQTADSLLGDRVYGRLKKLLASRGIEVDDG